MRSLILVAGIILVIGVLGFSWVIADHTASEVTSLTRASLWHDKRWQRQLAYRIPLIGIAIIPLVILDIILITAQFQTRTYNNLSSASNPALGNLENCPDSNGVGLTVTMRNLDSAQEAADADISLCVGDQVLRNLTVEGSGARPLSHGRSLSGLSASFLQSTFRVSYMGSIPETSLTRTVSIQSIIAQADPSGPRGPVDLGTVSIPLFGNAISYPLDSYSATGLWVVSLPANMVDMTRHSIQAAWTGPGDVAATPDSGNIAWRWGYAQGPGDIVEASRIPSLKIFALLISTLPILLFAGLLALLRPIISDPNREKFPAELLVAVGAFLLAIIPVRAVLVPSDISQITLTDYILGTEMAVIVSSSLMIVLAGSIRPSIKVNAIRRESADHDNNAASAVTSSSQEEDRAEQAGADPRHRGGLIGAILLGLTAIVAIARIRQLWSRTRKAI